MPINNNLNRDVKVVDKRLEKLEKTGEGYFSPGYIQDIGLDVYLELFVYNVATNELINYNKLNFESELNKSIFVTNDSLLINPGMHLRVLGYSSGVYKIKYEFYRKLIGNEIVDDVANKLLIKQISPSRNEIEYLIPLSYSNDVNTVIAGIKKLKTYVNFGEGNSNLIINSKLLENRHFFKFYEYLSSTLDINNTFWIVEKLLDTYEDKVTLYTEIPEYEGELKKLLGPKIDYKLLNVTQRTTNLENFDSLTAPSGSITDKDVIRTFLSGSIVEGMELNTDFRAFSNFIHFSSATQRLQNFKYKVGQIEFYDSKIFTLTSGTIGSASTGTPEISASKIYYDNKKFETLNSFDSYEKYMYFESHSAESGSEGIFSAATWPKYNSAGSGSFLLYSYSSSAAIDWYNSQIYSASVYDNENPNKLTNFVPLEIQLDVQNDNFVKFIDMIAQIFDINYIYINSITSKNQTEHHVYKGIPKEIINIQVASKNFDIRSTVSTKFLANIMGTSNLDTEYYLLTENDLVLLTEDGIPLIL